MYVLFLIMPRKVGEGMKIKKFTVLASFKNNRENIKINYGKMIIITKYLFSINWFCKFFLNYNAKINNCK